MFKKVNLIFFASIFLNILLSVFILYSLGVKTNQESNAQYPYLSPQIFIHNQNDLLINFIDLRTHLTNYLKEKPYLGMFFEYLPTGVSIGINENQPFVIASLLKVPLVMSVYKYIEKNQISLNDKLEIKSDDIDKNFGDLWKQGVGAKITVKEAIDLALTKSDNTARSMLLRIIPNQALDDVFDSLDIPKNLSGEDVVVTPQNYSSILRSLYLSSYVNRKYSNEILKIMSQTDFNDRITAGIPDNIPVAHKIGTYLPLSVYTDCGIVYVPKRPYIICLMSKSDEATAQADMKAVSGFIYNYVATNN